jgi:hypothetical protein
LTVRPRHLLQLRTPRGSLAGFPTWTVRRDRNLYRAHRAKRGPWWFSSDGSGRFDLADPHGTCYVASDVEAAVRERWGETLLAFGFVTRALAESTEISRLRVPHSARVGDLCSGDAATFGVSREINTTGQYDVTQAWAAALGPMGENLSGVRYQPRFSTDIRRWAIGLFGEAGPKAWPTDPHPIEGVDVARHLGIRVVDLPSRSALGIAVIATPPQKI